MKKILLLCSAGMSTSMVMKKMREAAQNKGVEIEVEARGVDGFRDYLDEYDIFLLGPQIRYKQQELVEVAKTVNKKVEVINPMDYGLMNGAKILDEALAKLG